MTHLFTKSPSATFSVAEKHRNKQVNRAQSILTQANTERSRQQQNTRRTLKLSPSSTDNNKVSYAQEAKDIMSIQVSERLR
mgnify:FL=1